MLILLFGVGAFLITLITLMVLVLGVYGIVYFLISAFAFLPISILIAVVIISIIVAVLCAWDYFKDPDYYEETIYDEENPPIYKEVKTSNYEEEE